MLSHVDEDGNPRMVDVSAKEATMRTATAQSVVMLPQEVARAIEGDEIRGPKGPVVQTAIIAGTMGAKRTSELIPFCHQIGLDGVSFEFMFGSSDVDTSVGDMSIGDAAEATALTITCTATARDVTGVEMEALTGASVAALTVYDMCKALSHRIVIHETRLLEKHGGKSDLVV